MVWFCASPFGHIESESAMLDVMPKDYPVFLVLNILIAVLLFLAIFLFNNRRRQWTVTLVSMLLIAASAVSGGFILYGHDGDVVHIEWVGGVTLLILTLVMTLLAYRGIRKDERIVRSEDRLR